MNLSSIARIGALGILVGGLVWIGLKQSSSVGTTPATNVAAVTDRQPAPDFTLKSAEGETFTLSSLKGKSPVLVNFFSTT